MSLAPSLTSACTAFDLEGFGAIVEQNREMERAMERCIPGDDLRHNRRNATTDPPRRNGRPSSSGKPGGQDRLRARSAKTGSDFVHLGTQTSRVCLVLGEGEGGRWGG